MRSQLPALTTVLARLEMIRERLSKRELQVDGLLKSQTVEVEPFVLRDARGEIRTRLDPRDHAPRLTVAAHIGHARLQIGLHADGMPDVSGIRG